VFSEEDVAEALFLAKGSEGGLQALMSVRSSRRIVFGWIEKLSKNERVRTRGAVVELQNGLEHVDLDVREAVADL
jgi:hypothetical protein